MGEAVIALPDYRVDREFGLLRVRQLLKSGAVTH